MVFSLFRAVSAPLAVSAQLAVGGVRLSVGQIAGNIINFLAASIGFVAVASFIYGALLITGSGYHEDWRNKGKQIMIDSLIAMAVVLGAYAILRTVTFFLVG